MDPAFDVTADLDTPLSAYRKLRPLGPRFLLESVESGERLGRYSFLGFGEAAAIRLGDEAAVGAPGRREEPLACLRRALAGAPRLAPPLAGVPFQGGLVGIAGYGLVRRLEPRLAAGRPGGDLDAAYLAPRSLLVFDHLTRRAALLHDGPERERAALRAEVLRALRGPLPPPPRPGRHGPPRPSLVAAEFLERVAVGQRAIRAGEVYQLVLSIRFEGECDLAPFEVYRALRLLNPSPYMYFLDVGDRTVVGSSPEALVRLQGREASLRPIAGTRPRGETETSDGAIEQELRADPKEAAEHVMLVDLARNDLGRVAVAGSVRVEPSRIVERYSHVMHLVSGVRGVLRPDADAFDLFAAAFPAGTVVGAPKIRAIELIDALEPVPRGIYAGSVGYFGHAGTADQAIAIRTLVLRDGGYAYQAGAGIVADSVPEREHAEILAKGAVLASALRLAEQLR
jgi:anthranilate synthase component 1